MSKPTVDTIITPNGTILNCDLTIDSNNSCITIKKLNSYLDKMTGNESDSDPEEWYEEDRDYE